MDSIRVIVNGALGNMGQTVIRALSAEGDMSVVCGVDVKNGSATTASGTSVSVYNDISKALSQNPADVVVDFSLAPALVPLARETLSRGIRLVSGTTGLSAEAIGQIAKLAEENATGAVIAPNFAIGSIVMMHLARQAAAYFDSAEIIEAHHEKKADAPSGTALATARGMLEARGQKPFVKPDKKDHPSRGLNVEGIAVHSLRLPGVLARQDVIFGAPGQTLAISHDAISRDCYMPGVIMAVRKVLDLRELVYGLDKLLGL